MNGKLNLRGLVDFYDFAVKGSERHATAVNAMMGEEFAISLMLHFFKVRHGELLVALPEPCNQGTQKGVRLDKWLLRKNEEAGILYQTEIKNWSAHSLGGVKADEKWRDFPLNSGIWTEYREKVWGRRFNADMSLKDSTATKVLTPMKPPPGFENAEIKPVICFWEGMHPQGKAEVFFSVPLTNQHFDELFVFSISNFVHQLLSEGTEFIEVEMPVAAARKEWIDRLFCGKVVNSDS